MTKALLMLLKLMLMLMLESQEKTRLYKFKLQAFPAVLFGMWRVVRITCSACFGRNPFARLRSLSINPGNEVVECVTDKISNRAWSSAVNFSN